MSYISHSIYFEKPMEFHKWMCVACVGSGYDISIKFYLCMKNKKTHTRFSWCPRSEHLNAYFIPWPDRVTRALRSFAKFSYSVACVCWCAGGNCSRHSRIIVVIHSLSEVIAKQIFNGFCLQFFNWIACVIAGLVCSQAISLVHLVLHYILPWPLKWNPTYTQSILP